MIKKIDLGAAMNAEMIELVRANMPVATSVKKGLLDNNRDGSLGYGAICNAGSGLGISNAYALITTSVKKNDTQFCLEIIDCNSYTKEKPVSIILKGYNANNTTTLNHFKYESIKEYTNILGGYVNGKLSFLIPGFSLYDSIYVRSIDMYRNLNMSISFIENEPVWESRFVAS